MHVIALVRCDEVMAGDFVLPQILCQLPEGAQMRDALCREFIVVVRHVA
jgi:hypothetical protein